MKLHNILVLFISVLFNQVLTLNILGVFPYHGKSHFYVFAPYLRELANRGHNLTVISYFPQEKPIENYHDISLAGKVKILEDVFPIDRSYLTIIQIGFFLTSSGRENCITLLEDENVQNLWKSKAKFDLVLVEQFNSDCALGLAHVLGAPVVGLTSHVLMPWHYEDYGVQYNPAYVPLLLLEGGTKPTLYQRIERSIFHNYFTYLYKFTGRKYHENTLAQYFDNIPPLEELARSVKCLLLYTNYVLSGPGLYPPNIHEVGGYHVAKPKGLPKDLKKFIEESEHGVIYISFGSMLQATSTPKDKLEAIIGAVSQLPQRIIWKWEEKTLPGNPKNIYISNWLPQNDILDINDKITITYLHDKTNDSINYRVLIHENCYGLMQQDTFINDIIILVTLSSKSFVLDLGPQRAPALIRYNNFVDLMQKSHPNVLAFYSHCGMLGSTEAIHHGVPMIGMPIFGDQPGNAAAVEESGLGVQIHFRELTTELLLEKIKTVLNPEFRRKVKDLSRVWHDRPQSAMDSAIYWTEFTARTSNHTFRTPASAVPLYQYRSWDIIVVFGSIIFAIFYSLKMIICLLTKSKPQKIQRKIKTK